MTNTTRMIGLPIAPHPGRRRLLSSSLVLIAGWVLAPATGLAASPEPEIAGPARAVLRRVIGADVSNVRMAAIPAEAGRDAYEYQADGGILDLRGSSAVALCRGFYDYAKANRLGAVSWAVGRHLRIPAQWPAAPSTRCVTPFEIRHAYNVVTAGYTTPYWTWERWERELDWQAMHGFNMLMAPVATEAITRRMWLAEGLSADEIDSDYCGPAHLPWHRMGNIRGIAGPLPVSWHQDQIALQHRILARMRELGMQPVVQSFAGFVPAGFARIHPETKLHATCWNGALPVANRPTVVLPDDPAFARLTKAYMDGWGKEFGAAKYYLVDSFNEMELPDTGRPRTEMLADYGANTWKSIHAAAPDAIWTIQGWTFGYQNWKPENLAALFSKVPDDRMLVLDYANDYFPVWKKYQAFHGKTWACGYVPNMGGKTAYTGNLNLYASGSADALKDPAHGNLKGFTISGEGLENNETLYELLTDMAWSATPIDPDKWLSGHFANRYGACPPAVTGAWDLLRKGCYSRLIDHPRFTWQCGGNISRDPGLIIAAEKLLTASDELGASPLYRADAVELAALAIGLKADEWYELAKAAHTNGDTATFDHASGRTLELLRRVDLLMEAHPYHRLERWIEFARAHGSTPGLKRIYETNAKCIVTWWAKGVQNYSARVWGGLVRDYYRERLRLEFEAMRTGQPFDSERFMADYPAARAGTSGFVPLADPLADARRWVAEALAERLPVSKVPGQIGEWSPRLVTAEWRDIEWQLPAANLATLAGVRFVWTGGNHRLEIDRVVVVADGKVVAEDRHSGYAGNPDSLASYRLKPPAGIRANNSCLVRARVKGGGGNNSHGYVRILHEK